MARRGTCKLNVMHGKRGDSQDMDDTWLKRIWANQRGRIATEFEHVKVKRKREQN